MSEKKTLSTITDIQRSGSTLGIYTYYAQSLNSIVAFITSAVQTINSVVFKENHFGYTQNGYPDVSFYIDSNGHMIVKGNDLDRFEINADGHLTITE